MSKNNNKKDKKIKEKKNVEQTNLTDINTEMKSYSNESITDSMASNDLLNTENDNDNNVIEYNYNPVIIEIPEIENSIFDYEPDVNFSTNIDYPCNKFGFNHFLHATKNKTVIFNKFEGKKKTYQVFNKFERYIDNYNESIGNVSNNFFSLNTQPKILSRGFYKLWEILMYFDLIDINTQDFVSAHLAEGPGSFIQATMFYRDMFSKKNVSKNDKYYAVTLHAEDKTIHPLDKNFIDFYKNEKPQRFLLHKTYSKEQIGGSKKKDNGDITNPKTIKLFGGQMERKADFITADGGFEWKNENIQEQEAFRLILSEVITAVKNQNKNGNFVCKFFETFTKTSLKILSLLRMFYDTVYIVKPLTSRESNSEKYIVCMKFKYDSNSSEYKQYIKILDKLQKTVYNEKSKKIVDIFTEYELSKKLTNTMIIANTTIANNQFKIINQMIAFIKKEIYTGEEYHTHRDKQINASKFWIDLFFNNDLKSIKNKCMKIVNNSIKNTNKKIDMLSIKLVNVSEQN